MNGLWMLQLAAEQLAAAREGLDTPLGSRLMGLVGLATMIGIAWVLSNNRRRISWRLVALGVALQAAFGVVVLKTGVGRAVFAGASGVFRQLLGFTEQGARFVFGNLVRNNVPVGMPLGQPSDMAPIAAPDAWAATGAYFAFSVLPIIIFFSTLSAILYYMGVMQWIVRGIAWAMQRTMGTSGAETLSAAGNIFVGPTEAPLLIKPFVSKMTYSELNTVMVAGFATIAGSVMGAYVGMLSPYFPDIAGHLLTASVMNAPAALLISKILVPEVDEPVTKGTVHLELERREANVIDAAATGASEGLKLALNVAAMLLAFIALIAMVDYALGVAGSLAGLPHLSLQVILGWILAPLAWLMGVPWSDAGAVGSLLGIKIVATEFVAYLQLGEMLGAGAVLSPRATIVAAYALLGFANIPTIAIQLGGIGGMAPERRGDLARLGVKAMIGGNLAAFMSASLAGLLV